MCIRDRSKGVGVYFVTQNPIDIPDTVLGQLGNRIQHALRAYTPRDQKAVNTAADTFRQNPKYEVKKVITQLKTGEALVSFLDEDGRPSIVERALIAPPESKIGVITEEKRTLVINNSPLFYKYDKALDRESAFEIIGKKYDAIEQEAKAEEERLEKEKEIKEREKQRKAEEKRKAAEERNNPFSPTKVTKSFMSTVTRTLGREIARGILGSIKKNL